MTKHKTPEEMKSRLLGAFGQLMQEKTYESITTRAISERAGVSYSALYTYFGSKEDLLIAYMEGFSVLTGNDLVAKLEALPEDERRSMTAEQLAAFIITESANTPQYAEASITDLNVAVLSLRNPTVHEYYKHACDRWLQNIVEAVRLCKIPAEDVTATVQYIAALAFGVGMYSTVYSEKWDSAPLVHLLKNASGESYGCPSHSDMSSRRESVIPERTS